jgi:hypothetical protein
MPDLVWSVNTRHHVGGTAGGTDGSQAALTATARRAVPVSFE